MLSEKMAYSHTTNWRLALTRISHRNLLQSLKAPDLLRYRAKSVLDVLTVRLRVLFTLTSHLRRFQIFRNDFCEKCGLKRSLIVTCFLLTELTLGVLSAQAGDAVIADLVVANSKVDLLAFFTIDEAFSSDMRQGVLHGIPVTFTFDFSLERVRRGWFDSEVRAGTFEHTMTYDNLKKEFTVIHKEGSGKQLVTDDLERALAFMVEVEGVKIVALEAMRPDCSYTLKVKATLAKTTLPLNFHYIIPFTEFWDLKTDWMEVDFRY